MVILGNIHIKSQLTATEQKTFVTWKQTNKSLNLLIKFRFTSIAMSGCTNSKNSWLNGYSESTILQRSWGVLVVRNWR